MTGFLNHFIKVGMRLATKQVVPMAVPPTPWAPIWPGTVSPVPALPFSQHCQDLL